jgi:hypothetical protein
LSNEYIKKESAEKLKNFKEWVLSIFNRKWSRHTLLLIVELVPAEMERTKECFSSPHVFQLKV